MLFRLFVFALLMLDGYSRVQTQRREYSMIELNHRYNEWGQPCYSQIIIWQWDGSVARHDVVAGFILRETGIQRQLKQQTAHGMCLLLIKDSGRHTECACY